MAQKLTAIDFGSGNIKFAIGTASKRTIKIKKMFSVRTPEGAIVNGEIMDGELLRDVLFAAVKKHKLRGKKVVATLQSNQFISREFTIPKLKKESEVRSALRFEVEQFMPIAFEEYVMSSRVLSTQKDENGKPAVTYMIGLMPARIVESYYTLLEDSGLNPVAMDVNFNCLEKFLDFCGFGNEVVLTADIGENSIDISVFENGKPIINRTVPVGGSEITRNISERFSLPLEEAERIKTDVIDLLNSEAATLEMEEYSKIAGAVVADWVEQLRRMSEFYMSRTKGRVIDSVYIYGGSSSLRELTQYLTGSFGITVRIIDFPKEIKIKKTSRTPAHTYVNAIGAIIRR